jgi:hypothetical protein
MTCRCSLHKRIAEARISPVTASSAYFDYNATTPVDKRVLGAYYRAASDLWAHPESVHFLGSPFSRSLREDNREIAFTLRRCPRPASPTVRADPKDYTRGIWGS